MSNLCYYDSKLIIVVFGNKFTIIIIMKTHRPFQSDSISTQEKEKKFSRKSDNKSSRSKSSRSDSKSISKFYVRNLQLNQKSERVDEIMGRNVKFNPNWSPPRRQSTPSKTQVEKRLTLSKQQQIDAQRKQIQHCKIQISKYKNYIYKQSQKVNELTVQNKKLKVEIDSLKKMLVQQAKTSIRLKNQILDLTETLNHKEIMLEYWQKQQPALKKVKTSIFQSRMIEFEKQKQQLNKKIKDLENVIDEVRNNSVLQSVSSIRQLSEAKTVLLDRSILCEEQYLQKIQFQLYQAKEQIKRLQISEACMKRKCYQQMEKYKQKKDKEYEDLKKKFGQFLGKYKEAMKKFATFQVKNALDKQTTVKQNEYESQISLILSEDQQHK